MGSESNSPRVRYFANEINLGMAANWTAALDRSQGELVGLLMDDDRLLPGFTKAIRRIFAADPSVGVVFTDHYFGNGKRLWRRSCALPEGRHSDMLSQLLNHNPVSVSAAVMRREVWDAVRPLPDQLTADFVMFARAASLGWAFYYVNEPLMVYRVHAGQLTGSERFRTDGVQLWSAMRFDRPEEEDIRLRRLRSALVSRAAGEVKRGMFGEALADLAEADRVGNVHLARKCAVLRVLAGHPSFARFVLGVGNPLLGFRNRARAQIKSVWVRSPERARRAGGTTGREQRHM